MSTYRITVTVDSDDAAHVDALFRRVLNEVRDLGWDEEETVTYEKQSSLWVERTWPARAATAADEASR